VQRGRDDVLVIGRERLGLEAELGEFLDVGAGDELTAGPRTTTTRGGSASAGGRRTPRAVRATSRD
jgi:hypothetical protein